MEERNIEKELLVESCTLKDLLSSDIIELPKSKLKGTIYIPEYQRPYVWKEMQVGKLLNDLISYKNQLANDKPLYYLGNIILHFDGKRFNIIDGQQRITTLLILNAFAQNKLVTNVDYYSPESIDNIKYNHLYLKAIFNQEISSFQDVSVGDIPDFDEINVTLIITKSEDLAYTFFETQNTGGVRLNGTDIAKAHHLRAIESKKLIAHQARKWESISSELIEYCITQLTKIRYWNNRKWRIFPFYRNEQKIKEEIIKEYTENTIHDKQDVSFYYSKVNNHNGKAYQSKESDYRQVRQPLADGNNFMDYINEYVALYQILFVKNSDYRVSNVFYRFRDKLLHGRDGTLFLKELLEIALITYVSRFGFERLYEISLWMYRQIYSMRVSLGRNVREDSISKFVLNNSLIDTILESYTIGELVDILTGFSYLFDSNNIEDHQSKNKYVKSTKGYFDEYGINKFTSAKNMAENNMFDKVLTTSIMQHLKTIKVND